MTRQVLRLAALLGALSGAAMAQAGCDGAPEPCEIMGGRYHILLPEGRTGPVPAVLFLHGHGGDGAGSLRNRGMVDLMLGRGYAVIAPDGQPRATGKGRSWDFHPNRPAMRDETTFLRDVAEDASARFRLRREAMLLAGFSIGGSLTSYVACAVPGAFAAYAPVAGSFWRPHPAACAGPVRMFHTHGTADQTVPLAGRLIHPGFAQGDVVEAMEIWRATNGCAMAQTETSATDGPFRVQRWTGCQPGADLRFALHDGGHGIPAGWARMALDWFERR